MKAVTSLLLATALVSCTQKDTQKVLPATALIAFSNEKGLSGYKDLQGKEVIPAMYSHVFADTVTGKIAFVATEKGIIAIDAQNKTVLTPFVFDNGPDPASEGVFRFVENKKMGFATPDGEKIISATHSFVAPFAEGFAAFCDGCKARKDGEMHIWRGGKWGFLDKTGKVAIAPIFDEAASFEKGTAAVRIGKESLSINTKGSVK